MPDHKLNIGRAIFDEGCCVKQGAEGLRDMHHRAMLAQADPHRRHDVTQETVLRSAKVPACRIACEKQRKCHCRCALPVLGPAQHFHRPQREGCSVPRWRLNHSYRPDGHHQHVTFTRECTREVAQEFRHEDAAIQ